MLRSLVVLAFLGLVVAGCPDTWIQIGDNCYKVSPERMNWYSAQEVKVYLYILTIPKICHISLQYCIAEGGFLIEINDEDEQVSSCYKKSIQFQISKINFKNTRLPCSAS